MRKPLRLLTLCLALTPLSLLLVPSSALADDPLAYKGEVIVTKPVKELHDGLYIGLDIGADSYRVHSNINSSFSGDTVMADPALDASGIVGGLFGGYGQYFYNLFYLGGEAYVNLSGATSNVSFIDADSTTSYNSKITIGTSFGLSLLPGIKVNDSSLFYLRFGTAWANIKDQENFVSTGLNTSFTNSTWTRGYGAGLGIETVIYCDLSMRAEYNYTAYNDASYTVMGTRNSPTDNQFMLGLIYHIR